MRGANIGETSGALRLLANLLIVGAIATCTVLVSIGVGVASGAVAGSKVTITAQNCITTSCQITMTMTGIVKVTPTGTVDFLVGSSFVMSTGGGPCAGEPMVALRKAKAEAVCDAAGLPPGTHKITASYSGDNYFDPSRTTRPLRVKKAA